MIRQLDFLTGFALRAGREPKHLWQPSGDTSPDANTLNGLERQAQGRDALRREPALDDVLADPIIKQLMSSDDVKSSDVMRVMGRDADDEG